MGTCACDGNKATELRREYAKNVEAALRRDPSLQDKVNLIAYIHHLMFNGAAASFVNSYLDPKFKIAYEVQKRPRRQLFMLCTMMAIVITLLPLGYGRFLMKDPCDPHSVRIESATETFSEIGCGVEEFMKSSSSLLMGITAMLLVSIPQSHPVQHLMVRLSVRRYFRWSRIFVYNWVHKDVWKLWYQPFNDKGRNLALHCTIGLYAVVLLEFMLVGILLKDGVAIAVGYASAKLLLVGANVLLAPTDMRIQMVNAELREAQYFPAGHERGEDPVMLGLLLGRLLENKLSCFFLTHRELDDLYNHPGLRDPARGKYLWHGDEALDKQHREGGRFCDSGLQRKLTVADFETPITHVYITDSEDNVHVPVQQATRRLREGEDSDSDADGSTWSGSCSGSASSLADHGSSLTL